MIHIRKITRGSKKRFDYSVNLPKEIVEELELIDSTVKLVTIDGKIIIEKIIDDSTASKPIQKIDEIDEFSSLH